MEGIKKTFTLTGTKGASARVTVTEQYDIAANTSALQVAVELALSSYYGHTYYLTGQVTAGQKKLTMQSTRGTHYVTVSALDTYYPIKAGSDAYQGSPWSFTVNHESDGTKSVTVAVEITGYEAAGRGASGFTITGSETVTLTPIPRASTVAATDAAIESVSAVSVSRKSSRYTHSVAYAFEGLTGYLTADGETAQQEEILTAASIPFRLPASFYDAIPSAKTGTCILTCRTYYGDTQIGQSQTATFTVTAAESRCAPTVTGTVQDVNAATVALTGDADTLVRYMSSAQCTLTAAAKNGATVKTKTIAGTAVTGSSRTITGIDTASVSFSATDSRGYTAAVTVEKTLIPYVKLTCVATAQRPDPTSGKATLTVKGAYYSGSFGAKTNTLTLTYTLAGTTHSVTPTVSGSRYTATVNLTGLDYQSQHPITVTAADLLSTAESAVTVKKGIPVFDWGEEDFAFHVPVLCQGGWTGGAISLKSARVETDDELTELLENHYTAMDAGSVKLVYWTGYPSATSHGWFGLICKSSQNNGSVKAWSANLKGSLIFKVKFSGTWQPLEWENPPLVTGTTSYGTEYRTTQRYEGKTVYARKINLGNLPASGQKSTWYYNGATNVWFQAYIKTSSGNVSPMPYFTSTGTMGAAVYATDQSIVVCAQYDLSAHTGFAIVHYTKD